MLIKNIEPQKVQILKELVNYNEGQIVSRTLAQNKSVSITLFAFDKGEEISSHESTGDAWVILLDGKAKIKVGGQDFILEEGNSLLMPANIPHELFAEEKFKMQLTIIYPIQK